MPQLTHDTAEDGFHEIQLSGKQLVFLFMATTVVSVVIFLCGVLVGRNARTDGEPPPPETTSVTSPTDEVPVTGDPSPIDEATPVGAAELTYAEQLKKDKSSEELKAAPPEKPVPPPPAPVPAAAPPPEPAADVPTAGRPGAWVIQVHALSNRGAASSVVKGLIAKGYPAFLALPPRNEPVIYRVQIGRYKDRRDAEQVVRRLQKEEQFKPEIKR